MRADATERPAGQAWPWEPHQGGRHDPDRRLPMRGHSLPTWGPAPALPSV